jgi:hypothetical protein
VKIRNVLSVKSRQGGATEVFQEFRKSHQGIFSLNAHISENVRYSKLFLTSLWVYYKEILL